MKKNETPPATGFIDRGTIKEKKAGTHLQYKVKSLTYPNVTSRWIESVGAYAQAEAEEYEYAINDEVYFCLFPDGRGIVLGKMTRDG